MPTYETVFIVKPDLAEEGIEKELSKVEGLINRGGGKVDKVENWGKKRLAYQVAKNRFGHYLFLLFQAEPHTIPELERHHKLNENTVKYMTIRLDEKLVAAQEVKETVHEESEEIREAEEGKPEEVEKEEGLA